MRNEIKFIQRLYGVITVLRLLKVDKENIENSPKPHVNITDSVSRTKLVREILRGHSPGKHQ